MDNIAGTKFQSISIGSSIRADMKIALFGIVFDNKSAYFEHRMELHDRFSFIIHYESLYGEQYEVSHNIDKIKR